MKKIILVNPENNEEKEVNTGYSFATLLLNFLVPLFRKDLLGMLMILGYDILAYVFWRDLNQAAGALVGFVLLPVFYNKLYMMDLQSKGYVVKGDFAKEEREMHLAA